MRVWLKVRIDVSRTDDSGEDVDEEVAATAAQEAVYTALIAAEGYGFVHERADDLSLRVDYVAIHDADPE